MKWRFMAAVMAVALLVILVQDIPLSAYLQQVEHDRIITALERDAFVLAGRSEEALGTETTDDDQEIVDVARLYRESGGARVVIVDADGIAVATSDDDQSRVGASYASRPEIMTALAGETSSGERYSTTLSQQLLYVTVPIISGPEIHGAVRLTYPAQVVADAVDAKVRVLWLVALTTVVLAGIVAWIFSSGVTRRLRILREATERLADGRRDWHADEKSGAPELRSLSKSFNIMAARLHALIDQQRSFAADASHQLRTPLTALRGHLELLDTGSPDEVAETKALLLDEVDRMSRLVGDLILLAKSERPDFVTFSDVDLGELT
ncbi:MAG: histidine kinase dimerization/phospho-acceptor domain-containing protein, partial [Rhodoglobus sp.]|nr:histidine kinase dimerization/phospho-acceptor domain-containing protein [Rhodoglobus sp.]